jgi:hypothetical protein
METFKIRIKYKDLIIKIENLEIKFKIAWKPKFKISLFKKLGLEIVMVWLKKKDKKKMLSPPRPHAL